MEDGPYRARRPTGGRRGAQEDPQDVLARHGLLGSDLDAPPPGSRAARRRAAERDSSPVGDSGRHAVDVPPGRHGAPREDGHRYRADAPVAPPARGGGRRHAPEPFDAPGGRRNGSAPDPDLPAAGGRRRLADDFDEPAAPRRRRAAGPPDEFAGPRSPEPPRGRRHLDPGLRDDPGAPPRRRRADDADDPPVARRAPRERARPPGVGPPARAARRDPVDAPNGERRRSVEQSATTALPATAAGRRRTADPDAGSPATTAIPTGGRSRPRRPDSTTDAPAATTAIPTAPRRRPSEPGATRRPPAEPPDRAPARGSRARPAEPATTALPANGRKTRTDAPEPAATTALPAARSRRGGATNAEATVAARKAPADGDGDGRSDRELDARTRAMRIDETLTRMTAAHAGVTLAVTDRPAEEPLAPPPRRGAAATAGRLLAGALALVVLAATAFGWGTKTWLGSAVRDADALDPSSSAVVDAAAQAGDENVLVVATAPASDPTEPRADTVAVAHVPDSGGPVTVLAFPLDLEINRPPCETWDAGTATYRTEPVQAEARTQLASALDLGGPRCITRVVQQLSGLAITKYVGMNLAAVPAMTDAVGGAEICVPRPVLDGVLGPVVPDPGPNRLEGVRVADFVQAGDVEGEPSPEYGRIERQQKVLAAVLDSAVSGTALLDVGRLMALRPTLSDAVLADGAGIDQVLALSMTLRRLDSDGVRYAAVPTAERNSRGNAVLRDTDAAALFSAVRGDQPLPADATDPGAGTAGPTPSEVTVEVVNASSRSGLAGEVSETLSSLGFDVGEPGSADQPTSETVIRFSPDQAAAAEVLRATVPSATEVPDPGSSNVLQLVLGQSFDDVVRAPSEPIALAAPTDEAPTAPAVTCT
ncbi:LCP family glycopolymer transferase [Pseudonocardia sp. DLS-67]